jgi:hypothetical protein
MVEQWPFKPLVARFGGLSAEPAALTQYQPGNSRLFDINYVTNCRHLVTLFDGFKDETCRGRDSKPVGVGFRLVIR